MDAATVSTEQVWSWLGEVADPEIPVISVVDLGIVRDVACQDGEWVVTITPTYSGCPAMQVIADAVDEALRGFADPNIVLIAVAGAALIYLLAALVFPERF